MTINKVIDGLENLKDKSFWVVLSSVLLIAAGIQTIFVFSNDLFLELEIVKLMLLALTFGLSFLTIPFTIILLLVFHFFDLVKGGSKVEIRSDYTTIIFAFTSPIAYIVSTTSLVISYLFSLDFIRYLVIIFFLYLLIIFIALFVIFSNLKKFNR